MSRKDPEMIGFDPQKHQHKLWSHHCGPTRYQHFLISEEARILLSEDTLSKLETFYATESEQRKAFNEKYHIKVVGLSRKTKKRRPVRPDVGILASATRRVRRVAIPPLEVRDGIRKRVRA